jgi:hypothetical protein
MLSAMSFLHRADIAVHTAATNEDILMFHLEKNAHLIATHPALPGMACDSLCEIIRKGESMKKVSILLLCDGSPRQQELARRCNVNAVLTLPVDTATFAGKVQELLDVPPRHSYRVVLNIAVEGMHNNRPVMCNSENISASGMLIRAKEHLAVGGRVECSFYLPDGFRVSATGDIARVFKADQASDTIHYGIRFQRFASGAEAALAAFVEREMRRQHVTDRNVSTLVA